MSLTRSHSQLDDLSEDSVRHLDLRPSEPQAPRLARWLTERDVVPRRWPLGLGLAWLAVYAMAILLEPTPADPQAADPIWAVVLFTVLMGALAATCYGLARRQRLGLVASVAAAGLALAAAVSCPVSAHHQSIGAWWFLQMAGFTALMTGSLVGLTRSRSGKSVSLS